MNGMTRIAAAVLLVAGASSLTTEALAAPDTVPGAPWVPLAAPAAFSPLAPGIQGRPSVLLETDYYVYGPGTGFTEPELHLTLAGNGFQQPATLYLYWQNRDTGTQMFFNSQDGFGTQERSVFENAAGRPIKVRIPDLDDFELFGPDGAFGPLPGVITRNTGLYQFVLEVRDPAGNLVWSRGNAMYNFVDGLVQKGGAIHADETWTSNNVYRLASPVNVFDSVLTIEPGTVILGVPGDNPGTLIIRPGAQIMAQGDAMRPIIFSSEQPVGERSAGDWGGLVLNGNAPTNQENPEGEGDSGIFGGDDPNDDSGTLSYVRVEFAGTRFSNTNELNGIALQGVGRATTIDHIQVHFNQDDGIEFFGGTAQVKFVLLTGEQDDSFDWTFGWQGRAQFVVVIQQGEEADKGIEADNFESDFNASPRSHPVISHCTFVKKPEVPQSDPWAQFRRGTGATVQNCIVEGFNEPTLGPVFVDDVEPPATPGTDLIVNHTFFFNNQGPNPDPALGTNLFNNPMLPDPFALVPDIAPLPGPARSGAVDINDPFFDNSANYVGGVDPTNPWIYEGWTTFSDN